MTNVSKENINILKNKYYYNNLSIGNIPCLLVFNNGMIDSIYSVRDNNYDIEKFFRYVNQINYEMDDLND